MRVVWVLGGHESVRSSFEQALARHSDAPYLVRHAELLDEVPHEHMNNTGVVALVDAFHPSFPGFDGVRELRARGFTGPVFLFGEPAPEVAANMMPQLNLAGFFPPFERVDTVFVSGVIHAKIHFAGHLEMDHFLNSGGRASSDIIHSLKDFNAFATKLAGFVARFGIDLHQLKRVLMGMTLPHIKAGTSGPGVEQPFTIQYGMDPGKLLLAIPSFSRGLGWSALRSELSSALSSVKAPQAPISSMHPEIHHVIRATENLLLFCGNARSQTEAADPLFLMTCLPFPAAGQQATRKVVAPYFCVGAFVQETPDMSEEVARAVAGASSAVAPEAAPEQTEEAPLPSGLLEDVDLQGILSEPRLIGDQPHSADAQSNWKAEESPYQSSSDTSSSPPPAPESGSSANPRAGGTTSMVSVDADEVRRLKEISKVMSEDIKRLMKERREPTTDRELREAKAELEDRVKKLALEKTALQDLIAEREKQIEVLKAQVESLRRAA